MDGQWHLIVVCCDCGREAVMARCTKIIGEWWCNRCIKDRQHTD